MSKTLSPLRLAVLITFSFLSGHFSRAAVIDFEQVVGAIPYEGMQISNQFKPFFGITFRRDTNQTVRWPVIARIGAPLSAFDRNGSADDDTLVNGAAFGLFFLTDTAGVNGSSKLILDFAAPVSRASGDILDIDSQEMVTVSAYADATSTNALETRSFSNSPPTAGDGLATLWSFNRPTKDILRIEIDSNAPGAGLGYDLFSSDYAPTNQAAASLGMRMYPGLSIMGDIGRPYKIQYTNHLSGSGWITLTNIFLPTSPFLFLDLTATNDPQRFYRVQNGP